MGKIIGEENRIDIYQGANGLYYDASNKGLSYLSNITEIDLTGLEEEISKKKSCQIILGEAYDPYPAIEADLNKTRAVLELIDKYKCGVTIFTSSKLVLRDLDLLKSIATHSHVVLMLNIFTTNETDSMNISGTSFYEKIKILEDIKGYDVDLGFDLKPILPFISDDINNIASLIELAAKYQIQYFLYRGSNIIINNKYKEAVYHVLDDHYFGLRSKYDAIRNESYVISSPKQGMLENYIKDLLSSTGIMYNSYDILKKIHSYQKKHKQLSMF